LERTLPPRANQNGAIPPRRVVNRTRYEIRDEAGKVQAVHVRLDYSDGTKECPWELADGTKGLGGRALETLPLYGIEKLR
jgi:hypothetical protein